MQIEGIIDRGDLFDNFSCCFFFFLGHGIVVASNSLVKNLFDKISNSLGDCLWILKIRVTNASIPSRSSSACKLKSRSP